MRDVLYLDTVREIDKSAGGITPSIVEELKADMKDELGEDLIEMLDIMGFITWNVDTEHREIQGVLRIPIMSEEE